MHAILDECPPIHLHSMVRELLCYLTNLFLFIVKELIAEEQGTFLCVVVELETFTSRCLSVVKELEINRGKDWSFPNR
jgi:hypothetical protein